jgi:hypothetical protein
MKSAILDATAGALRAVTHPRFLRSERGYQGRFYCALQDALDGRGVLQDSLILEMEYQKSGRHGLTQRPDIILHAPAETEAAVFENNIAVFALKLGASPGRAGEDFIKLDEMCATLQYQLAIFINVNSDAHHMECYGGQHRDRLHSFAVTLQSGQPHVTHAWWEHGVLRETNA